MLCQLHFYYQLGWYIGLFSVFILNKFAEKVAGLAILGYTTSKFCSRQGSRLIARAGGATVAYLHGMEGVGSSNLLRSTKSDSVHNPAVRGNSKS